MPAWKKSFKQLFKHVRSPFKKAKLYIKQRLGWLQTPIILPFRGFGNSRVVHIKGRVLEDNGLARAVRANSILGNIWAMVKRFASDEIPGVRIKATFKNIEKIVETGEDGMFTFDIEIKDTPIDPSGWDKVHFELLDEVVPNQGKIDALGSVMFPPEENSFGVISDVDDTFLVSHSTNSLKKLRLMLLKNARTRMPFKGVVSFYQALHCDKSTQSFNPIFYVSSSEWNLYDLLVDFCDEQDIPRGPFLLKHLKTNFTQFFKSGGGSHLHKLEKIRNIFNTFEKINFVLIGDSGQHDAEIYDQIASEFPDRIIVIYIRDVKETRHSAVKSISQRLGQRGISMLLVKDTEAAAVDAVQRGLIDHTSLESIRHEKQVEENARGDLRQVLSPK